MYRKLKLKVHRNSSSKFEVTCVVFITSCFLVAVEISGHEKPIIVGLMGDINCSTHLNSTSMEWFLVGVDDSLEKSYNHHLTLTIDAKTAGLNGAMFTCRVTDVEGNKYEESVTITVKGV